MATQINVDELSINTIRTLAMDAVQKAKSGHPGMPMGMAAVAYVLWTREMRHNPRNPHWLNRDRFVLSAGHGSMLLYSLLYLTGYDLPLEELQAFRQWGSKTPGHPELHETPGVETTTGPLGQGFGNGVGFAIASRHLAARFNTPEFPLIDNHVYAIVSDGDLMEGVAAEAASLAGHLKLGNLIYLYDNNRITIEGSTALAFTENVSSRFAAYGWHVQDIPGYDLDAIERAIRSAREVTDRPSLINVTTHIGYGSPNKQDTAEAHGSPLGEEEVRLTKKNLGWPEDRSFYVPPEALQIFRAAVERGEKLEAEWKATVERYAAAHPDRYREWQILMEGGGLAQDWESHIPSLAGEPKALATREASGKVLAAIFPHAPGLVGGSADLSPSTNTYVKGFGDFEAGNYAGRNFHFGVREHGMGAVCNGIALFGGLIPYGATFLIFSDYMRPSVRLAALMKAHVIYVWTHDSVGLGEDGPTHQPVEHAAALRAIPGLTFIRPSDATETSEAWRAALRHKGPVALALTRQKLPVIDRGKYGPASGLHRGAYILSEAAAGKPDVVVIATGSEVSVALGAQGLLEGRGVPTRVVSMPCWEFFRAESREYRDSVIPRSARLRVAVEAASPFGWERWVGEEGIIVGIDRFGASAPYEAIMKNLGFTPDGVAARVLERLAAQ